jgi:hypothetical protein
MPQPMVKQWEQPQSPEENDEVRSVSRRRPARSARLTMLRTVAEGLAATSTRTIGAFLGRAWDPAAKEHTVTADNERRVSSPSGLYIDQRPKQPPTATRASGVLTVLL